MDFEAVSWRPARRLRHVTAIRLHNLYDPTSSGAPSYHYELHTWCVQRCTWTLFYRSEQLPTNNDLDWGRPLLDSESEIGLQGLQHRPDVGPLRLRVYVTCGNSTTVPAASTNSPRLPIGPRSPPQDFAAAVFVLPHEQSDCNARHIPRMRREAESVTIRSDCSVVHEQQKLPSPSALPAHPTWQGRPHSSAAAGAAGDVSFPSQCWEQSKLESLGVRPAPCHSIGSEGKAAPLWAEMSGPGPPSKAPIPPTQQQPLDPFAEGTFGGSANNRGVGINGPKGNLERGASGRSAANLRSSALQQDYGQLSNHGQQEQGCLYFQVQQETMQLDGNGRQASSGRERVAEPFQRQEHQRTQEQQQRYDAKDQQLLEQDGTQMGCNVSCAGFEGAETPMDASAVLTQPVSAIAAGTCSSGGPGASSGSSSRGRSSDFGVVGEEISISDLVCGVSVSCETVEAMQGPPCDGGPPAALRSAVILSSPCTDAFPEAENSTIEADLTCGVQPQQQQQQQLQLVEAIKQRQVCRGFAAENDIFDGVANGIQPVRLNVITTESSPTASSSSCASDSASVLKSAAGAGAEGRGQAGATAAKPAEGTTINSVFRWEGGTHRPADNTWDEVRRAGKHPRQVVDHVSDGGDRARDDGSLRPGGGNTRVLLECVFELNALVPLEPRTLRHGWYINLPVLFMEPNRRPFIPSSALPPPPPPPPPAPRQQPSDLAPGPDDGSNGAGPMCRKRFVALPAPLSAVSGNRKPAAAATAGVGGGRGTGYHRRSSSGLETGQPAERPSDDKRALLRWLMSSSSVVQPLQAAGSLEEELQDDDFLAAAAAEAAEAAATATTDGQRPSRLHVQPPQAPRPRTPHHHRSFSAEDAAALLDPGPAPGFLPSALAVLFRQEWPRHPAGPPPAPQHGLRPRSPGLDASPAAGSGLKSGLGRASPLSRRVASTPTLAAIGEANAAEASLSDAPDAPSAPSLVEAAGDGGSEARCLADDAVATRGSLLSRSEASGGYLAHACEGKGDDRLSAAASPASSTVSYAATTSGLVAVYVGSLGGSQASLTGLAAAATAGGVWRMASSPSLPSTAIDVDPAGGQHNSLPPHVRPLLLGPRPLHSGSQSSASLGETCIATLHPGSKATGEEYPVDFSAQHSSAATAAGITRMPRNRIPVPVPATAAIVQNHNHYQHQHQKIPLSASASASVPAVQRLCELVEVRASIRKLKQLQERLTGARAGALDMRRQVDAAVERRYQLDEARARAEAARAECQEWAARARLAEAQLCARRASTARYRRELLDRVRALETASVVLKAAERRRLSAEEQLAGPTGVGQLAALTAAIVKRRNRLVSELGGIFQVGPISEALLEPDPLDLTLESSWAGEWGSLGSYRHLQRDGSGQGPAEEAKTDQNQGQEGQRDQQTVLQQTDPCQRLSFQSVPVGGALSAAAAPLPPPPSSATRVLRMDSGSGAVVANNGTTRLAVMGLELPPDLIKRSLQGSARWSPLGLGQRYDADQRTSAGLGYLAAIVDLASSYLGIPLRYPIAPRVSVSYISDPVPPSANVRLGGASATAGPPPTVAQPPGSAISAIPGAEWRLLSIATSSLTSAAAAVAAAATGPSPLSPPPAVGLIPGPRGVGVGGRLAVFSTLLNAQIDPRVAATPAGAVGDDAHPAGLNPAAGLPLFWGDGARDRTRFAYAVYLLSKDVEQLLAAHGIPPVAPNQPLPNLYVLITAAASGVPRPPGNASTYVDSDGDDASGRGEDGAGDGI